MKNNNTKSFIASKGKFGMKLGLDNIKKLLDKLDNPQNQLKFIHIAGSNGKGSITRMLESVLKNNNYRVGVYSSPHLVDFNERIRLNEVNIPDDDLDRLFLKVKEKCNELVEEGFDYPTGFEIETAIAFLYFLENNCDICLLEVGLGGRLDATNIIKDPIISIISSISLEHSKWLGDSLYKIAKEKAGIIKDGTHVIVSPQQKEVEESIREEANNTNIKSYSQLRSDDIIAVSQNLDGQVFNIKSTNFTNPITLNLLGNYQESNLLTVINALEVLSSEGFKIKDKNLHSTLEKVKFPGRFEVLSKHPYIVLDGAHNYDGIKQLVNSIKTLFNSKVILFFGMLEEKNITDSLKLLCPISKEIYLLEPNNPEALDNVTVNKIIHDIDPYMKTKIINSYEEINNFIKWDSNNIYLFTGSLYLIGEVKKNLRVS